MSWFGDDLKLPQDDSSVKRTESLAEAREKYVKDDHKLNLNEMTVAYENPDGFDLGWLALVGKQSVDIAVNMARIHRIKDRAERLHSSHVARVAKIGAHKNPMARAMADVHEVGEENQWPDDQVRPKSVDAYDNLFQAFDLPAFAQGSGMDRPCFTDEWFAGYRLNGPNPHWIRRVTQALPDDYAKLEDFGALTNDSAAFGQAVKDGRVFVSDYSLLLGVSPEAGGYKPPDKPDIIENPPMELPDLELREKDPGAFQEQREKWIEEVYKPYREQYDAREKTYGESRFPKVVTAPVGIFAVSEDGTRLDPIGIQVAPATGGAAPRIYTPNEGWAWRQAKLHLQMADGNVHQAIAHLAETHMCMEVHCLAMHHNLAPQHPLHHLLEPHFEGTLLINGSADSSLVGPSSGVDNVMMGTIGTSVRAVKAGFAGYDFNAMMLPHQLESRGFSDEVTKNLHYSYRADGTVVWGAMHTFVSGYVDHYYRSDGDVASDQELGAFVKQIAQSINGIGENGSATVSTKAYLVDMLTHIIFTGSAQHAAVNFPQIDLMSYAPNQPLAAYAFKAEDVTEQDFLDCLPPLPAAGAQLGLGQLLGGVNYTKLGHYPTKLLGLGHYFKPDEVQDLNDELLKTFDTLEAQIDARIKSGKDDYHYLRPPEIPMSINI